MNEKQIKQIKKLQIQQESNLKLKQQNNKYKVNKQILHQIMQINVQPQQPNQPNPDNPQLQLQPQHPQHHSSQQQQPHPNSHQNHHIKWQPYQPKTSQNNSIILTYCKQLKNVLLLIIILSSIYLILAIMTPFTILVLGIFIIAIVKFIQIKLKEIRKQGLQNKVNEKWRKVLFEKSIFDIYSDLLYFPTITKIIGAFIKPAIAKPHPQQLKQTFFNLPPAVQNSINKKGLLSLMPQNIQNIVIDKTKQQQLPKQFGTHTWNWYNNEKYQNLHHLQRVHEHTLSKTIIQKIDKKISWTGFVFLTSLVGVGIYKMKPNQFKKMLLHNSSLIGVIMLVLVALIKIKKIKEQARNKKKQLESMNLGLMRNQQKQN